MTSRIGSPDTNADLELRRCLDERPTRSFIMVAGAGSGKTTSLVKALAHLESTQGMVMRRRGQKVACITYTEVAVGEIWGDVGNASLFHVSTIHSFLWAAIHAFQTDLRSWVREKIEGKIVEAEAKIGKPRTHEKTKVKLASDIARYNQQLNSLADVQKFTYGVGSNYSQGVLGHSDILEIGPAFIKKHALLRSLLAQRYPYIFVDESQDTNPEVVEALKEIAALPDTGFCLGFFGDPMQKIYTAGAGAIAAEGGWNEITKPENFRCSPSVLSVINNIRAEDDGLQQVPGRQLGANDNDQGSAHLFLARTGADRATALHQVREWMANENADLSWRSDEDESDVRLLVLVHRIAASRLGFPDLYAALNDNGATSLKEGLLDGTAWVLRPFLNYLLPLVLSARIGNDFDVISLLRKNCPALSPLQIAGQNLADILARIKGNVDTLVEMLAAESRYTVRDVLTFIRTNDFFDLDERFFPYLEPAGQEGEIEDDPEYDAVMAFLNIPVVQLWGYSKYVEDESPFATQQGVKGAQFQRVLVVLDDEESQYNLFSYGKYFGIEPLSERDEENITAREDSVLDRTRRLFYVCCSRAIHDLAVVFFVSDVEAAREAVVGKGIFNLENVHVL